MTRSTFIAQSSEDDLNRYGFTVTPFLDEVALGNVAEVLHSAGAAPDDPRASIHFGFFSDDVAWKRRVTEEIRSIIAAPLDGLFDRQHAYFIMLVAKWPGELGGFSPHQDPSFVDESEHRTVTVWCPLVPTGLVDGRDNGQLHLVPGSHVLGPDVRVNDTSHFAHRASEALILSELGVAVPTDLGQAVVFDNRTVHYSFPNRTESPRVALAIGLRPVEARMFHFQFSPASEDMVDVHPIDDDYFIDLNPLRIQIAGTGTAAIRTLRRPEPVATLDLTRAWQQSGVPSFATLPSATALDEEVAYCFVCAGTENLLRDPARARGGMAVCTACVGSVLERCGPPASEGAGGKADDPERAGPNDSAPGAVDTGPGIRSATTAAERMRRPWQQLIRRVRRAR